MEKCDVNPPYGIRRKVIDRDGRNRVCEVFGLLRIVLHHRGTASGDENLLIHLRHARRRHASDRAGVLLRVHSEL